MMSTWKTVTLALGIVVASVQFTPTAKADEWNKQTTMTFTNPVEVPGRVLLPGSYTFKLADSEANRQLVEIYNNSNDHLVTTVMAAPDYRLDTPSKTVLTFSEGKKDSPEAIHEWFYPGDNAGLEFIYPAKAAK
jgi:hypothetical protein